jgi:hypothetical protein
MQWSIECGKTRARVRFCIFLSNFVLTQWQVPRHLRNATRPHVVGHSCLLPSLLYGISTTSAASHLRLLHRDKRDMKFRVVRRLWFGGCIRASAARCYFTLGILALGSISSIATFIFCFIAANYLPLAWPLQILAVFPFLSCTICAWMLVV